MMQSDFPPVQGVRPINKNSLDSRIPVAPTAVTYIDCHPDLATKRTVILWEDIKQAFDDVLHVRHQDFNSLKPYRIAAMTGVVLDVVVRGELTQAEIASPTGTQQAISPESFRQEHKVEEVKSAIHTIATASTAFTASTTTRTVHGHDGVAMDNYSHIDNPAAAPFSRAPQAPSDNFKQIESDTQEPQHSVNKGKPRAPQEYPKISHRPWSAPLLEIRMLRLPSAIYTGMKLGFSKITKQPWIGTSRPPIKETRKNSARLAISTTKVLVCHKTFGSNEMVPQGSRPKQCRRPIQRRRFAQGRQRVPQDFSQAMDWYRKAADQGNPEAQFRVGLFYGNGQ
ncbi:hypothetical protein BGX23_003303, partial [Mortierella sp. AD031]